MPDARAAAGRAVAVWFTDQPDLPCEADPDGRWRTVLSGDHKRAIGVDLRVGERETSIRAHVLRAPDQGHGEVYAWLLSRHLRSYVLRFALGADGDVLLLGVVPNAAVDVAEVDRLMGQLLTLADEAFAQLLHLGFADYIAREQRWRAATGQPGNPIS